MSGYNCILFDLDGTLLDTHIGIEESVRYTLNVLQIDLPHDVSISSFIGPPIQESLARYCNFNAKESQYGANVFREYYKNEALYKASLYDGIIDLIHFLLKNNILIGVATYKREDYALKLLQHFNILDACSTAHGADNENKLKKSEIIALCYNELNLNKDDILYIGDTEGDALAAKSAGVDFLGVTWGFGFNPRKKEIYSNLKIVDNPLDIIKFI